VYSAVPFFVKNILELDNILSNKLKSSHVVFFYKKVIDECTKLLKFAISSSKQNCSLLTAATDFTLHRNTEFFKLCKRVREIFRQLQDTGTESDYVTAKTKLQEYFEPQQNRRYAVYQFRQAKQEPQETPDQFHTRLASSNMCIS
jgi:hypothetical protein